MTKATAEEIARRARVSLATVNRVRHDRPGVRPATAQRVRNAIASVEAAGRRVGRIGITVCVSLGEDWMAAVLRDQLLRQLDTAVADRRFRLEPIDPARDMMLQVESHRAGGLILRAPQTPTDVRRRRGRDPVRSPSADDRQRPSADHLELLAAGELDTVADLSAEAEAFRALRLVAGGFDGQPGLPPMPTVEFHVRPAQPARPQ